MQESYNITKRLYEEIKIGMNRIKKNNPNAEVLQISCNQNGTATTCIGKNNTIINWNLSNIDLEYLKELLIEDEIKVVPKFDYNKKLLDLSFIIDYRKEEVSIKTEVNENNKNLRKEEIEEKLEKLTEYFASELDKSSGILRTTPLKKSSLKQTFKDFLEDLKQAIEELNLSLTKEVEEQIDVVDKNKQKKF